MLRFLYNLRCNKEKRNLEPLSVVELKEAKNALVKLIQAKHWQTEIERLRNKQALYKQFSLISLKPYLNEGELLRVGGRLDNSDLPDEAKHPLLIPATHHFTKLIVIGSPPKITPRGN